MPGIKNTGICALLAVLTLLPVAAAGGSATNLPLPPTTWDGRNCISYNTGGQNMACPYDGNPFQLKGYSKGGTSTLSYALQCDGPASGKVVVYPQVWFESSQTVSGNFTVYGKKATMTAMAHCMYPKGPALIIFLKPGGSGRSIHIVYTDNADFPWGKAAKPKPKPNYRLAVNITGPSTVTNDGSSAYAYKLPVSNTGKLKIRHAQLHFSPIGLKVGSSVHWSASGNATLSNLRAGTKRTITVRLKLQGSTVTSLRLKLTAKGLGIAKKAKASKSKTVKVVSDETQTTTT